MRAFLLIFSLLLTSLISSPTMGGEHDLRVVSTSLCGDAYVTSMVAPDDILALSWQSDDPLSATPSSLRGKPKAWDDPERLLALKPNLVVFGSGEGAIAKPILDKAKIHYVNIQWGENFNSIQSNQDTLTRALGQEPGLTAIPNFPHANPTSVLYLSSSGGTAGPGTYVDEAIRLAGGTNIITKSGWHTPDPENLAVLKPDLIITSFFKDGYASINESSLRNKVLQDKIKLTPHINVPGKLWPCAGPRLYEATELIVNAIAELSE